MAQEEPRDEAGAGEPGRGRATPRGRLAGIEGERDRAAEETEKRIMGAMLIAAGERGYRAVTVRDVIERYGGYRGEFYRHFASKAACYEASYEAGAAALTANLLAAGEAERGWRAAVAEALRRLAGFLVACPEMARGLLVEVHVARGQALAKHREVVERLSRAVDRARREPRARHSPPPLTAEFMVLAVESAVASALLCGEPRRFEQAIPELTEMVVGAYFGE